MKPIFIFLLIIISIIISIVYFFGYKKNVKLMKAIALSLENALKPDDQIYTYLGGVLGFSANYTVKGFKEVKAVLRLIPRHSALYWPLLLITGAKDSLQMMFYTEKPISQEFHIIKKSILKVHEPKIYNRSQLVSENIVFNNKKFEILKEIADNQNSLLDLLKILNLRIFSHLAATKDHNIIYIQLLSFKPDDILEIILKFKKFLLKNL